MPHLRAYLSAALSLSMLAGDKNPEKLGKAYSMRETTRAVKNNIEREDTTTLFFKLMKQVKTLADGMQDAIDAAVHRH